MSSLRMPGSSVRTMTDWAVSQHSPARRAHVGKLLFDSFFPPCLAARTYRVSAPLLRVSTSRQPSLRLSQAREIPRSISDRSFLMGSIVSSQTPGPLGPGVFRDYADRQGRPRLARILP